MPENISAFGQMYHYQLLFCLTSSNLKNSKHSTERERESVGVHASMQSA